MAGLSAVPEHRGFGAVGPEVGDEDHDYANAGMIMIAVASALCHAVVCPKRGSDLGGVGSADGEKLPAPLAGVRRDAMTRFAVTTQYPP